MDDTAYVQNCLDARIPLPPGTYWIGPEGVNVPGGSYVTNCVFKLTDDVPRIGMHYVKDGTVLMGRRVPDVD